VNQCDATGEIVVGEVGEILSQLQARQHALIDDGLARERTDVKVGHILLGCHLRHAVLNLLAYDVQRALKGGNLVVGHSGDKHLLDVGL